MFESLFEDFDVGGFFDEFRRLENQMNDIYRFGTAGIRSMEPGAFPPVNVGAGPKQFDIYFFAANLDSKSINVSIQQNVLTVSGSRKLGVDENAQYYRRERFNGDFTRVLTLPEDADPEHVDAKYADGVLHITVRRRESAQLRQITVN